MSDNGPSPYISFSGSNKSHKNQDQRQLPQVKHSNNQKNRFPNNIPGFLANPDIETDSNKVSPIKNDIQDFDVENNPHAINMILQSPPEQGDYHQKKSCHHHQDTTNGAHQFNQNCGCFSMRSSQNKIKIPKNSQTYSKNYDTFRTCSGAKCSSNNNKGVRNLSNYLNCIKNSSLFGNTYQNLSPMRLRFEEVPSLQNLPIDLFFNICSFLTPKEIYSRFGSISKLFRNFASDCRLWNYISKFQSFIIQDKYKKIASIVERRSKGKLFQAVSRLDKQQVMIRNINIMISNAGLDDGVPTSILRELSYLQSLDHQNITKFQQVEINGSNISIVSQRCDFNLKEYIKHSKSELLPLSAESKLHLTQIKTIFFQILQGIDYLHHNGIIHRNLKIDNILIQDGVAKISDFALSRLVTIPHIPYTPEDPKERERSGREARRLWYRAPELLFRKNLYSFEVDIWSLGCLLAEIVLSEPLFSGDSEIEQLFKIFRMIGSPNQETMSQMSEESTSFNTFPKWKVIDLAHICTPTQSSEFKELKQTMIPNRQNGFQKLKFLGAALGMDGMSLLNSLLQLNPSKRITAQKALQHPFFDEIRVKSPQSNLLQCCHSEMPTCVYQLAMPNCYLENLYRSLVKQEKKPSILKDYLSNTSTITENMRIILVDWLVDVSLHFEAQDETLHYCVSYIDKILSVMEVERQQLQLIGVSCMKIADVFNERSREYYKQENAIEYAYITAEEYSSNQLIAMEKVILKHLNFQLHCPTIMHFLKIICTLVDIDSNISIISMFLADLLLISYEATKFSPSLLANCCVFFGFAARGKQLPTKEQHQKIQYLLKHHTLSEFQDALEFVRKFWQYYLSDPTTMNFESVYKKYVIVYGLNAHLIQVPIISSSQINEWNLQNS